VDGQRHSKTGQEWHRRKRCDQQLTERATVNDVADSRMKHGWRQCQARQDDAVLNLERGERRSGDQQQQPDGKTKKI